MAPRGFMPVVSARAASTVKLSQARSISGRSMLVSLGCSSESPKLFSIYFLTNAIERSTI